MILYLVLAALVVAAVPTVVWLKRAGDAEWRRRRVVFERTGPFVLLTANTEEFARAIRQVAAATTALSVEMNRARGPLERVGRQLDRSFLDLARQLHFDPKDRA